MNTQAGIGVSNYSMPLLRLGEVMNPMVKPSVYLKWRCIIIDVKSALHAKISDDFNFGQKKGTKIKSS